MPIYLGSTELTNISIGANAISEVYVGDQPVFGGSENGDIFDARWDGQADGNWIPQPLRQLTVSYPDADSVSLDAAVNSESIGRWTGPDVPIPITAAYTGKVEGSIEIISRTGGQPIQTQVRLLIYMPTGSGSPSIVDVFTGAWNLLPEATTLRVTSLGDYTLNPGDIVYCGVAPGNGGNEWGPGSIVLSSVSLRNAY